jgi:hypothetical protein
MFLALFHVKHEINLSQSSQRHADPLIPETANRRKPLPDNVLGWCHGLIPAI